MMKSKFSPTQIAYIIKEFDNGKSAEQISREQGLSPASFFKWRSRYAGMNSKELKRLKEQEEENRKLKQMYADLALDHQMAKEIIEKSSKDLPQKNDYQGTYSLRYQQGEKCSQ